MAFSATALALIATGNGNRHYLYRTTDSMVTVTAAGYFSPAYGQLNVGDVIEVIRTGTNPGWQRLFVTASSSTAVVTTGRHSVTQSLAIAVTAVASTEFTLTLPPCVILRVKTNTTTAFTGNTVTIQYGSTLGGVDIVAATTIKAASPFEHTVVTATAAFAGGTLYCRVAQTATETAVGAATSCVEYIPT